MADAKDKKDDPNAALATALSGINKTLSELPAAIDKSVSTAISRAVPRTEPKNDDKATKKPKREPVTDEALEGMDRKGLVSHIVAEINEQLITPLRNELQSAKTDATTKELRSTWQTFMGDKTNKAMMDGLKEEVTAVIKEKPSMASDPRGLLLLAKDKAPDKVKAIEEAAKADVADTSKKTEEPKSTADKAAENEAAKIASAFGGLEPSSGTPGASDDNTPEKVPLKKAVSQAYDEVLAALPGAVTGAQT